jgi:site-specific DNA-methyltransferase (adenine-specific)
VHLPLDQILLGDCIDHLRSLPDASIDSVVTDPPYGLGNRDPSPEDILAYVGGASSLGPLKKGRRHCLNSVLRDSGVADAESGDAETTKDGVTFRVSLLLNNIVAARVIKLDSQTEIGKNEVDDEGTIGQLHDVLVNEVEVLTREGCDDSALRLREREGFTGCVQACSCFSQLSNTLFRVVVWLGHDSFGEAQSAASILTARAAEACAVLTLDVARLTGELRGADRTDQGHAGLLLAATEDVRASPGTSRLLTALQVLLAGKVRPQANGTLTFDVTVPRVLLRRLHEPRVPQKDFMNRSWELPSVAVWREVYRVLKPGGYVVSFAGTRTFDVMSIGLRMAGFECRDTISRFHPGVELPLLQWVQSQGMSKSRNVFKYDLLPDVERQLRAQGVEGDIVWR